MFDVVRESERLTTHTHTTPNPRERNFNSGVLEWPRPESVVLHPVAWRSGSVSVVSPLSICRSGRVWLPCCYSRHSALPMTASVTPSNNRCARTSACPAISLSPRCRTNSTVRSIMRQQSTGVVARAIMLCVRLPRRVLAAPVRKSVELGEGRTVPTAHSEIVRYLDIGSTLHRRSAIAALFLLSTASTAIGSMPDWLQSFCRSSEQARFGHVRVSQFHGSGEAETRIQTRDFLFDGTVIRQVEDQRYRFDVGGVEEIPGGRKSIATDNGVLRETINGVLQPADVPDQIEPGSEEFAAITGGLTLVDPAVDDRFDLFEMNLRPEWGLTFADLFQVSEIAVEQEDQKLPDGLARPAWNVSVTASDHQAFIGYRFRFATHRGETVLWSFGVPERHDRTVVRFHENLPTIPMEIVGTSGLSAPLPKQSRTKTTIEVVATSPQDVEIEEVEFSDGMVVWDDRILTRDGPMQAAIWSRSGPPQIVSLENLIRIRSAGGTSRPPLEPIPQPGQSLAGRPRSHNAWFWPVNGLLVVVAAGLFFLRRRFT